MPEISWTEDIMEGRISWMKDIMEGRGASFF
jgi:hypothetical protein